MDATGKNLVVVSNTSPLTNLSAIGQFDLLQKLFGELHIPHAVINELSFGGKSWPGTKNVARSSWIKAHAVIDRHTIDALRLELDLGEAEAIALAFQLNADLILLDERAGRRAAEYLGLPVMGVVGLLVRAKQLNHIPTLRPLLEALQYQAGFYLSQSLVMHALSLVGESQEPP